MTDLGFRMDLQEAPPRRRRMLPGILAMVVLAGLLLAGATLVVRSFAPQQDAIGSGTGQVFVIVNRGDSLTQIAAALESAGVVSDAGAFIAVVTAQESSISPGRYTLPRGLSPESALAAMQDPASRVTERLVVKEGARLGEIITAASEASGIPASQFREALAKPSSIKLPAAAQGNAEGWLFPATYDLSPDSTATSILRQMTDRWRAAADDLGLQAKAAAQGLTVKQVMTIASLIEAEVAPQDFGKASRVIRNRLDAGMPLQLDSTVNYALDTKRLELSAEDLAVDSPYNTYLVKGLPPGPIASPGEAAIDAALAPEPGPWKYFVAVDPKNRVTEFAETYEEFLALKKKYQQRSS